jgi:hypothetical protein
MNNLNYNKRKFKYTYGDEFTLSGESYIGYYNVDIVKGQAYQTRYDTDIKLTSVKNINSEINLSEKYFERTIFTDINITYSLDDLLIKPNEIINKNSLNYKFNLIYDNFVDLYRQTKICDPLLPTNFNAFAAVSAVGDSIEFEWYSTTTQFICGDQTPGLETLSAFSPDFLSKDLYTASIASKKYTDSYTYIIAASASLFLFNTDTNNTSFNLELSTNSIGSLDSLFFGNITSIVTDNNRHLYVIDRTRSSLYKLDINTIVNKDRTGQRQIKLIESLGGTGNFDNNLNDPTYVEYGNGNIFVYSAGDNGIKKYTDSLNFISEYRNEIYFNENPFKCIAYNPNQNLLYILSENYNVLVLDADTFNKVDEYTFKKNPFDIQIPFIDFFEIAQKLTFSQNNSNIYYLQTNKNIYKYFVSTKNELIERFTIDYSFGDIPFWNTTFTAFSATEATWSDLPNFDKFYFTTGGITIVPGNGPYDRLLALSNTKIFEFLETDDFISLLNNENPNFYNKSSIELNNEYFNNITLNQSIYKLIYNINLLSANVNKQMFAEFDLDTYLRFKDFNEFDYFDKSELNIDDMKQFFVGVNETVNGNTLNRVLTEIYDYQEKFLYFVRTRIQNKRIPSLVTVVIP